MKRTLIPIDGDFVIREANYVYGESSSIVIEENIDSAAITIGYADENGDFKAYPDGGLYKNRCIVNHRAGVSGSITIMARIENIVSNPVKIMVNP